MTPEQARLLLHYYHNRMTPDQMRYAWAIASSAPSKSIDQWFKEHPASEMEDREVRSTSRGRP